MHYVVRRGHVEADTQQKVLRLWVMRALGRRKSAFMDVFGGVVHVCDAGIQDVCRVRLSNSCKLCEVGECCVLLGAGGGGCSSDGRCFP